MSTLEYTYSNMSLRRSGRIQLNAISALTMRELHTRFGDHYLGYLWLLGEPALLSIGVSVIHLFEGTVLPYGIKVVPFTLSGYTGYCLFRSACTRSVNAIHSNRTLLYHRYITVLDILTARAILETAACLGCSCFLMVVAALIGLGDLPERPLIFFAGWGFDAWLAFDLSLLCCAWSTVWEPAERLIHPMTYFALPISGAFTLLTSLPAPVRPYIAYFPPCQVSEMLRAGTFYYYNSPYIYYGYMLAVCSFLTLFGLVALRAIRDKIEL